MRIMFVNNGITHYFSQLLNKITYTKKHEITLVCPRTKSRSVGSGVYQTKNDIRFKLVELSERKITDSVLSLKGLMWQLILNKPAVLVLSDAYLYGFVFNPLIMFVMRILGISLILRSIPFQLPGFREGIKELYRSTNVGQNHYSLVRQVNRILRRLIFICRRIAYAIPDAHVNYTDIGYDIYGSYGVERERIFVTWNSPDTDLLFDIRKEIQALPLVLPKRKFRIIHVGRLVAWKRVDLLITSFSSVRDKYSDSELVIIGSGPEESELRKLTEKLKIDRNVRFLGAIHDPQTLGRYFRAADVYVLAGMGGLSINDAMCFGLPIVCSIGDGTEKRLVRDGFNGYYFKEGDKEDLVVQIEKLFEDPRRLVEFGNNSLSIIEKEVNIHTVISEFENAFAYVRLQRVMFPKKAKAG